MHVTDGQRAGRLAPREPPGRRGPRPPSRARARRDPAGARVLRIGVVEHVDRSHEPCPRRVGLAASAASTAPGSGRSPRPARTPRPGDMSRSPHRRRTRPLAITSSPVLRAMTDAAAGPDPDQARDTEPEQLLDHDGHARRPHPAGLDAHRLSPD